MFIQPMIVSGNTGEQLPVNVNFVSNVLMGNIETRTSEGGFTYGITHFVDMLAGREVTLFFNMDELEIWKSLVRGKFYELQFEVMPGRRGYEFTLVSFKELSV